jgi:hypothetical protein
MPEDAEIYILTISDDSRVRVIPKGFSDEAVLGAWLRFFAE